MRWTLMVLDVWVGPAGYSLVCLMFLGCHLSGDQQISFDGEQALAYIETQLNFGPRIPKIGTRGQGPLESTERFP